MKSFLIFLINCYQYTISPDKGIFGFLSKRIGSGCVFYPTCSDYAKEAVAKYGVVGGIIKASRRVLRCRPGMEMTIDKP